MAKRIVKGSPTAQWARATRQKRGLGKLGPEEAHGWGLATRKKLGKGAVRTAPTAQERTLRRHRAKATQTQRGVARQQRATRRTTQKAKGVRRAQTSRPSGKAGGRRARRGGLVR